jgi:hypothetical protein
VSDIEKIVTDKNNTAVALTKQGAGIPLLDNIPTIEDMQLPVVAASPGYFLLEYSSDGVFRMPIVAWRIDGSRANPVIPDSWVACGWGNMDDLVLPANVANVTLLADNDAAGRYGVGKAARAFTARGKKVRIATPPDGVKDFNELVAGKEGAELTAGFGLVRARIEAAEPWQEEKKPEPDLTGPELSDAAPGVKPLAYEDFVAYVPTSQYVYLPSGDFWAAKGVNKRLIWKTETQWVTNKHTGALEQEEVAIPPADWLDRHSPVDQASWLPGELPVVLGVTINLGGRITNPNARLLNLYRPPTLVSAKGDVGPWLDHFKRLYPDHWTNAVSWLAFAVQRPEVKINHELVLGGGPGIGKDALLEPVRLAVGPWNFGDVTPGRILDGNYNEYRRSVILRISEAKNIEDEYDRYNFYEARKILVAAPPETLEVNGKYIRHYYIPNLVKGIITTNHKTTGLYLPADSR